MDELEIRLRLLRKDPAALEQIFDTYGACVYKLVSRILRGLGNSSDIEECCSDAFFTAWEKSEQYDPARGGLRTWILILARSKALDCRRRLARLQAAETGGPFPEEALPGAINRAVLETPEERLLQEELRFEIAAALAVLPAAEKEVLYRRYFLEESIDHIAADLGITRGAADNRLWRARRSLKQRLTGEYKKVVPING